MKFLVIKIICWLLFVIYKNIRNKVFKLKCFGLDNLFLNLFDNLFSGILIELKKKKSCVCYIVS